MRTDAEHETASVATPLPKTASTGWLDTYQTFLRFESRKVATMWTLVALVGGLFPTYGLVFKLPGARITFHEKDQPFQVCLARTRALQT